MFIHIPPSLRHRQFRLLWIGLMVSMAGTQMQVWSIFWHIRTLTDQPIALGGVGLARILPIVGFSLVGGAVADMYNRRKVTFIAQSIMTTAALVLALLSFAGEVALWHIYILTAVQATAVAFDTPSRQSLIPNLVPARDLPNAFSLSSIAFQIGSIAGPALSGLVIAFLGQPYTYLFNAVTYLAVLVALVMMGKVEQQVSPGSRVTVSLTSIREGIRFIMKQPIILSTMILDFFATFFSSANKSIGAVSAALVISQIKEIRRQGPIFLTAVVIYGIATVLFGISRTVLLAFNALILAGAADAVSMIIRNTIRQLQTPDYIRGRMTSINQIFFMGGPQLGEVEAGLVAQFFGAPFAVVSGGVACILAVSWVAHQWPQVVRFNGDEPIRAGS